MNIRVCLISIALVFNFSLRANAELSTAGSVTVSDSGSAAIETASVSVGNSASSSTQNNSAVEPSTGSLVNSESSSTISNRACLENYRIAQQPLAHSLTAEQLLRLQEFVDQGLTAEGWAYLGTLGDHYARISARVVSLEPRYRNEMFHKMVERHWLSTVGREQLNANFQTVAAQHFRQYVEILQTGFWPDSDQILLSYLTAARQQGLSDNVVFDQSWVRSGLNRIIRWESILGMQRARIVRHSIVCSDIKRGRAFFRILFNLVRLPF